MCQDLGLCCNHRMFPCLFLKIWRIFLCDFVPRFACQSKKDSYCKLPGQQPSIIAAFQGSLEIYELRLYRTWWFCIIQAHRSSKFHLNQQNSTCSWTRRDTFRPKLWEFQLWADCHIFQIFLIFDESILSHTWIVRFIEVSNWWTVVSTESHRKSLFGCFCKLGGKVVFIRWWRETFTKYINSYLAISDFWPYPNDGARLSSIFSFS